MTVFLSWVVAVDVVKVLALGQVLVLGSDVSFSANHDENQNIKLSQKHKYPKHLYNNFLMCSWHLCSDK